MPSLVFTKNENGPRYGDWADDDKRRKGQVIAGNQLLSNFGVPGTDMEKIVRDTLQGCWDNDCSIWMKYDGDVPDSFAIIEKFDTSALSDEDQRVLPFIVGMIKLDYYKVKVASFGDPITTEGNGSKLTLRVQDDSPPGQTQNKRMNVVIPSDFANFEEGYLKDMTQDIESMPPDKDVPYLLSSLTFRRCL